MASAWRKSVFHTPTGVKYAVENSQWATRLAAILHFWGIDKDLHITKDGVVVCGHWGLIARNGFLLPAWFKKKYGKYPKIRDVYWVDLQKLRTPPLTFRGTRVYRFVRLVDAMALAHKLNRGIMGEQKGDARFAKAETWRGIDADRQKVGLPHDKFVAATLPDMNYAAQMLLAAHSVGTETMVIRAQDGVPRSWEFNMTWFRGKIKWLEGR